MTDFVVLTGFLGSGKTTLLRDFLTGPEAADTAFMVNEAGEIGLDGVILREGGGDTQIAMLSNGCICCQAGTDLSYTVDRLLSGLEKVHPAASQVLELRFFGGLTDSEAAEQLGLSRATVQRHLDFGKAWVYRELHAS